MKTNDEIISRFDLIPDMPVTEDTLGAYIEGNLNADEMDYVYSLIHDDPMLADLTSDLINDVTPDIMPEPYDDIIYTGEDVYAPVTDDIYQPLVDTDVSYMPEHDDIGMGFDVSDITDDTIDLSDIINPDLPL